MEDEKELTEEELEEMADEAEDAKDIIEELDTEEEE